MRFYRINLLALIGIFLLNLGGCAGFNPFDRGTSDINDTYRTEISDIPIPKDMGYVSSKSHISNTGGIKTGYMYFSGAVEWQSLQNACIYNLYKEGWSPMAIYKDKQGIMVFEKDERVCTVAVSNSFPSNTMEIWVTPRMHGFTVPPTMPVSPKSNRSNSDEGNDGGYVAPASSETPPASSNSNSGGINEQGLSE